MNNVLSIEQAIKLSKELHQQKKTIVLVGGCFDILHIGHITFLQQAKKQADMLFVLLESDQTIKKQKGNNRPVNIQHDRGQILSELRMVDAVIMLPDQTNNKFYDDLVMAIKPAIIATTAGDPNRFHKERQAEKINAKVVDVTAPLSNRSTTKLIALLNEL